MLGLTVFGPPTLRRGDDAVALPIRKSMALLLLLAGSPVPMPRTRIAALLWPDHDGSTGRRNLRRELARLKEAGVGDAVDAGTESVGLARGVAVDTAAFEAALDAGRTEDALGLWRGSLADGFALGDADAFDEWLQSERERLGGRRREALRSAASAREAAGDAAGALAHLETLLAEDPLQEQHHRDAMRLLAALGRREAALAQHARCRALLHDELGLEPMAETDALAAAIRGGRAAVPAPPPRDARAGAGVATAAPPTARTPVELPAEMPFVGRAVEIAALEAGWAAGRAIVVEGEGGVGKTRLASDFAAAHGPYALARCRPGDAELPYASFARMLRSLMGASADLAGVPVWATAEVARIIPELGAQPPPMRSDEERARFFEACALVWQALAGESFDAVVFDDWHLADAASRTLVAFLARRRFEGRGTEGAREVLVLRPELEAAAAAALRSLVEATGALHLRLEPLPPDAVLDLLARLSGVERPTRFAARLGVSTGGNPFFLAETLRHLVESGQLSSDATRVWQTPYDDETIDYRELPTPPSVRDAVLARVRRLPAASQRVLEAAALATEPFTPRALASACALSELDTVLAIEDAVGAQLLHEHGSGGFAFAHDLVGQALSSALSSERRRLVHRRLALAAEAIGAPAAEIAAHHEASGEAPRAVAFRIAAGAAAARLHALAEAVAQWQKALADGADAVQSLHLHERLSWAAYQRGDRELSSAAVAALGTLVDGGALDHGQAIDAAILRARALGQVERSEEGLAALEALPPAIDERQRARFLRVRSRLHQNLGRFDAALEAVTEALRLPSLGDDDRIELLDLAFLADHNAGRLASALRRIDDLLAVSRRVGSADGVARARFRRGLVLLQFDDAAGAESELLASIDDCERLGLTYFGRVAIYNLACVHDARCQPARTLAAIERGSAWLPPLQAGPLRTMFRVAVVEARLALGEIGAAWDDAQAAIDDLRGQADPIVAIHATQRLAETLALVGEGERLRALLAALDDATLREATNPAAELWVSLALFEIACGDAAAAERALARLDAGGGAPEARVRARAGLATAGVALLRDDPAAAVAAIPADDAPGMNGDLRTRALALRVRAGAAAGRIDAATLADAEAALAAPADHAIAALELASALARAARAGIGGAPDAAIDAHGRRLDRVAATLQRHPAGRSAFRAAFRVP